MTTIRVQCETCKATLRVRDEGFVGEVHACPRCGSMVLIAGAQSAPGEPGTETEAAAEAPAPAPITLGLSETLETLEAPPIEPPQEVVTDTAPAEEEIPAPAPARSNLAPLLTTITALTATTVIGIAWLLSPSTDPDEEPIAAQQSVEEPTPAPTPESAVVPAEPQIEAPAIEPAAQTADPEPTEAAAAPTADNLPPVEPLAPRIASLEETPAARPPVAEPITREIDPLAFDPDQIDLVLVGEAPREPLTAEPPTPENVPTPKAAPESQPVAQARDGVFVRLGSSGNLPTRSADETLAQIIPRIELREVPLAAACRLVGELAGAPVTLPPEALRRAGVSVDRPVDLIGEGRELGDLFGEALSGVRLAYKANGPHLTVVRKGVDQQRTVTHRLADLVGDSPAALTARLRQSVGAAIEVSAAGEAPLTAPMRTHYDLLVTVERLRLERGLPAGSKYPRKLLAESPEETLGPTLDRRATFSFVEPTPLSEVFAHWRRATGAEILVDWRALAERGLGPRSTIACSATNRPWRSALSGVLEPLGLTWRPAFGPAIAIAPLAPGQ